MKKITVEFVREFIANNKIPLLSTQPKLSIPVIDRICRKMFHGLKFDDIKTCDDMIIDGHHRYLSSLIMNFNIGYVPGQKTSVTKVWEWATVNFDKNDWDTTAKILHLNEQDAIYNNLDLEFVSRISLE